MLLVPRQLRRYGMTGDVPYYGGRFTPAQAYAASHPSAPRAPGVPSDQAVLYARSAVPGILPPPTGPAPQAGPSAPSAPPAPPAPADPAGSEAALRHLLESGVINQAEYDQLSARVAR